MRIFLMLSLLSFSTHASVSEKLTLEKIIDKVSSSKLLSCPGFLLTRSCGNRVCEADKDETVETCPSDCIKTEIRSYNHQTLCTDFKLIAEPKTQSLFEKTVSDYIQKGYKVRVVGKLHSANEQLCTQGAIVSTKYLNRAKRLEMFQGEETVVVEPGITINDLSDWLYEKGKSIGMTMIGYNGVSVAGSTATGSHGSSLKYPTVMASLIRSITMITSDGVKKTYHAKNTTENEWKALRTSLGMLGVITEMRLKVFPAFNLYAKVDYLEDEILLQDNGYKKLLADCDWGQLNWFPNIGKVMRSCAVKTHLSAQDGAENQLLTPNVSESSVPLFKQAVQLGACFEPVNRLLETFRFQNFKLTPPFVKTVDGKIQAIHEVIGKSHKITSSPFIPIKQGFFQMDWEFAVPQSEITNALRDVKKITEKYKVSLPLIGAFIRFTKAEDTTLIAHSSVGGKFLKGEDVAFIELPVYLPLNFNKKRLAKHEKPYKEFVNTMIEKRHARGHWGKNKEWVFQKQIELGSYQDKLSNFQHVLNRFDGHGVFANQFGQTIGLDWDRHDFDLSSPCSSKYFPVCDSNGNKYRNFCEAQKESAISLQSCQI